MSSNFEIRKQIKLDATPEQVWRAIATREGQTAWSPDPDAIEQEGMEIERDEPNRLTVRTPTEANGSFHAFEYVIEAQDDSTTVLRFVHSGFLGEDWNDEFNYEEMTSYGWDMYLHTLAQYLTYFPDQPATYIEATAPERSSTKEAWTVLEKALGLTGPVELGDAIELTPQGLPPIRGIVDYIEPGEEFLAVRTDEGLFRFHSLAPMGMPIAVGHYIYRKVDRDAVTEQWRAWLERVFA
ncbi:hypothetical protein SAMN06309944_1392 [Micrococcales bacterium KH10]|nr:hypothetical protein SAMN06309944_1392 [Micrococcales bacterium KH10]